MTDKPKLPRRETYGLGFISEENGRHRVIVPHEGKKTTIGRFDTRDEAQCSLNAYRLLRSDFQKEPSMNLLMWGDAFVLGKKHLKSWKSLRDTWKSLVNTSPIAALPIPDITPEILSSWATEELPFTKAKRSVLIPGSGGKRRIITLDKCIARTYATQAFLLVNEALEKAVKANIITKNPADGIVVPEDTSTSVDPRLEYLTAAEVDLLCGCEPCAIRHNTTIGDAGMLASCPHMPFENRVAFTLAIHQAPRKGELAALDWKDVEWDQQKWWITRSWLTSTKNGKARYQFLLPRSFRILKKWWEVGGCPSEGLIFPCSRGRKTLSGTTLFVHALDDRSARQIRSKEVVRLAKLEGISVSARYVEVLRSARRTAKTRAKTQYAKGYDWGFQDHKDSTCERPGWWRRMNISHRIVFHEMRDTAATHLLSGTWGPAWSMEKVSKFLGHSSVKVTEKRYAHLTDESARSAVLNLESDRKPMRSSAKDSPEIVPGFLTHSLTTTENHWAPEVGLEPTTTRLTEARSSHDFMHLSAQQDYLRTISYSEAAVELARRLLTKQAAGETILGRDLARFANAVLENEDATLALAILDNSPTALAQAVRLAEHILLSGSRRAIFAQTA